MYLNHHHHSHSMTIKKEISEVLLVWGGVATSIIVNVLPYLQFIAVVLAIIVSIKALTKKDGKG